MLCCLHPQTFQVSSDEFIESTLLSQNYDCVTQSFSNVFEVSGQNISYPISVDVVDFFTNQVISSFSSTENLITINGLASGLYSLQISSNNGCVPSQSETFFVDDSNPLIISSSSIPSNSTIYSGFDVSCSGASDAFIDITVEGGFEIILTSGQMGQLLKIYQIFLLVVTQLLLPIKIIVQ